MFETAKTHFRRLKQCFKPKNNVKAEKTMFEATGRRKSGQIVLCGGRLLRGLAEFSAFCSAETGRPSTGASDASSGTAPV
jgi:hypothetical protein